MNELITSNDDVKTANHIAKIILSTKKYFIKNHCNSLSAVVLYYIYLATMS